MLERQLALYATSPYPCSYLPELEARSQVAVPAEEIDTGMYGELVRQGFRRSGEIVYRPWCDQCSACVPVRIPVNAFSPSRSQKRAWQQHQPLRTVERPLVLNTEHFHLYQRYQETRHPGGGMDEDSPENYRQFLLQTGVDTRLVEFSDQQQVRMVSIIDVLHDGLSSVYTFFDPAPHTSYGTYNVLWQIQLCQQLSLPYLYLGYWIGASQKMNYKRRFQPMEGLIKGHWQRLED